MPSAAAIARPVVLCILDGWGLRAESTDNALAQARLPVWRRLSGAGALARIGTSGGDVGLPEGQMGNSEVGHMNIGAGRIALPELPRIDAAIADGSLGRNPVLRDLIARLRASGGRLHLMGLMSPGGVHAHQDQIAALAKIVAGANVAVSVHAFLDGRDTAPRSAAGYLAEFDSAIAGTPGIGIATIGGRYFAMDRDQRWERVEQAHAALAEGCGRRAATATAALAAAYASGQSDEFVEPVVIADYAGMKDGDGVLMANFRADRAREILTALLDPGFRHFPRARVVRFAGAIGLVEYGAALNRLMATMFAKARHAKTLGELLALAGKKQLRVAETEKFAHVTFFFNGGEETIFAGEDRILVPSPKVATYDLQPEMSAPEVTERLVAAIAADRYDFILVNFANPDMVGHTGIMAAAIAAAECVDACLGRVAAAIDRAGGVLLITADHGNLEEMRDPASGQAHTQHTTNPVPAILYGPGAVDHTLTDGRLCDIAPTLLPFLGLSQPAEMTGRSLLRPRAAKPPSASSLARPARRAKRGVVSHARAQA